MDKVESARRDLEGHFGPVLGSDVNALIDAKLAGEETAHLQRIIRAANAEIAALVARSERAHRHLGESNAALIEVASERDSLRTQLANRVGVDMTQEERDAIWRVTRGLDGGGFFRDRATLEHLLARTSAPHMTKPSDGEKGVPGAVSPREIVGHTRDEKAIRIEQDNGSESVAPDSPDAGGMEVVGYVTNTYLERTQKVPGYIHPQPRGAEPDNAPYGWRVPVVTHADALAYAERKVKEARTVTREQVRSLRATIGDPSPFAEHGPTEVQVIRVLGLTITPTEEPK